MGSETDEGRCFVGRARPQLVYGYEIATDPHPIGGGRSDRTHSLTHFASSSYDAWRSRMKEEISDGSVNRRMRNLTQYMCPHILCR